MAFRIIDEPAEAAPSTGRFRVIDEPAGKTSPAFRVLEETAETTSPLAETIPLPDSYREPIRPSSFIGRMGADIAGQDIPATAPLSLPENKLSDPNKPEASLLESVGAGIRAMPSTVAQFAGGLLRSAEENPFPQEAGVNLPEQTREGQEIYQAKQRLLRGPGTGAAIVRAAQQDIEANAPNVRPFSAGGIAYQAIASLPYMVAGIATTLATRSPMAGAAAIGAAAYGQEYGQERAAGVAPDKAQVGALFAAMAEAAGENVPLEAIMKPGGKFFAATLKAAGLEGIQEAATEILQAGYDKGVLNPEMTWGEAVSHVAQAGLVGLATGAATGGAAAVVTPQYGANERGRARALADAIEGRFDEARMPAAPKIEPPMPVLEAANVDEAIAAADAAIKAPVARNQTQSTPLTETPSQVNQPAEIPASTSTQKINTAPMVTPRTVAARPLDNETSVLENIRRMGGVRVRDEYGQVTREGGEILAVLKDNKRPGVINNTSGMSPDRIREAFAENGWFGPQEGAGADLQALYDLIAAESSKGRQFHPESETARKLEAKREETRLFDGIRAKAESMGIEYGPDWTYDDIDAAIIEREAMDTPDEELDPVLDARESEVAAEVNRLAGLYPDILERIGVANANVDARSQGPVDEAGDGATEQVIEGTGQEAAGQPDPQAAVDSANAPSPRSQPEPEAVAPPPAAIPTAPNEDGYQQAYVPGTEASQVQLRDARDTRKQAELRARQQQSKMRRGGQESVLDQTGGMFSQERNQGDLLTQKATPQSLTPAQQLPEGDGTRVAPVKVQEAAHVDTAREQVNTEPTDAQKEAGNFKKGHVKIAGLDVAIENPKGSERSGKGKDGKPWKVTMESDYGYVKRTKGADGEQFDVYLGPNPNAKTVFVIDQVNAETGAFDEHKAMIGFDSLVQARAAYEKAFSDGKGAQRIGGVKPMPAPQFKAWLEQGNTKKPLTNIRPPKEPPILKNPEPGLPSARDIDTATGKAHADEVLEVNLEVDRGMRPPPAKPDAAKPYSIAEHAEVANRIRSGDFTGDEARAGFERAVAAKPALMAEFLKMTKADLVKNYTGQRYRNDPKETLVRAAFDSVLEDFNPSGGYSYTMGEKAEDGLRRKIAKVTDEDFKKAAEARKERAAALVKRYTNPETISEYEDFIRVRGRDKLTSEQLAKYDELKAAAGRADQARELERKNVIAKVETPAEMSDIIETKHTQKGHALFVVQLSDRVPKEQYTALNSAAKRLGGYYSSFRGRGAVPGFQFTTREAAETFRKVKEGNVSRADVAAERAEETKESAVDHLREMADNLGEKADESASRDRLANTHRRARMAASAEAQAAADKALSETMRNIADAIESGEAKNLGMVRTKAAIETLDSLARRAKEEWMRAQIKADPSLRYDKLSEQPVTREMIDKAVFPYPRAHLDTLKNLVTELGNTPGVKIAARRLTKKWDILQAHGVWQIQATDAQAQGYLQALAQEGLKHQRIRHESEMVLETFKTYNRVLTMGLREPAALRAALREFLEYRGKTGKADPLKAAERALVGAKYDGYFPTPKELAARLVEEADIREGMTVLEPSAGKGDIADAVRSAQPKANLSVVEPVGALRDILEMKGHVISGADFMEHEGAFDRIVMNPPFEDRQDVAHVQHAYSLLKPGGRVVAIMSEGPFFGSDKRATEFREWLDEVGGTSEKLPEGSFAKGDRPTGVNTRLVIIDKPGGGKGTFAKGADRGIIPVGEKRVRTEDMVLTYTPEFAPARAEAVRAIRQEMNKLGLKEAGLRIADRILPHEGGEAGGHYDINERLITLALDMKDPSDLTEVRKFLTHEAVHAFRRMGGFTKGEWKILVAESKRRYVEKHKELLAGYADKEDHIEEGIAYEAMLDPDPPPNSFIARMQKRLSDILTAIKNGLMGRGFKTPESIFANMKAGKFARRVETGERLGGTNDSGMFARITDRPRLDLGEEPQIGPLPKYAGNINLERLHTPEAIKREILEASKVFAEEFDEARRGTMTARAIRGLAEVSGLTEERLLKRKRGAAFNAETALAARQILVDSAERLFALSKTAAGGSDTDLAKFRQALVRHVAIQEQVAGIAAEAGRALMSFNIIAEAKNQDRAISNIIEQAGGRDNLEMIARTMAGLKSAADITKFAGKAYKATTMDMILEAWYNAMLSNPLTHARNILGNTLTFAMQFPEETIAATLSAARGTPKAGANFGGPKDRVYFREIPALATGMILGGRAGLRAAATAFATEIPSDLMGKVDVSRRQAIPSITLREGKEKARVYGIPVPFTGEVKLGGKQVRTVGRLLMAEDEFFKSAAYHSKLRSLAMREAISEGLKGKAATARMNAILALPPGDMRAKAQDFANYQTFTGEPGKLTRMLMTLSKQPGYKWTSFIIPFPRVTTNIFKYALERTPAAPLLRQVRDDLTGKNGAASQDIARARIIFGSTVMAATAAYVAKGLITGAAPDDPRDREALYATGWQPYSFDIGPGYVSYGWAEPMASIVGMVADGMTLAGDVSSADWEKLHTLMIGGVSRNLMNKSYTQGIADAFDAIDQPERYLDRWATGVAATAIPAGVAQLARAEDPILREARGMLDTLKSRIPGQSQDLYARTDILGKPIKRAVPIGPAMLSPFMYSPKANNEAASEIVRLKVRVPPVERELRDVRLEDREYYDLRRATGSLIEQSVRMWMVDQKAAYSKLPDSLKKEFLDKSIVAAREAARGVFLSKNRRVVTEWAKTEQQEMQGLMDALRKMQAEAAQ